MTLPTSPRVKPCPARSQQQQNAWSRQKQSKGQIISNTNEINAKILYWGLANSGKTANLTFIHSKLRPDHRGDLQTLALQQKTYQVLPIELGQIQGCATRFQIFSLPGGKDDAAARQELSSDAFGIVFVADSQGGKIGETILSYNEMAGWIQTCGLDPKTFPVVVQYNKRDLPMATSTQELEQKINKFHYPYFETMAKRGEGVLQSLTTVSKSVIRYMRSGGRPLHAKNLRMGSDVTGHTPHMPAGISKLHFKEVVDLHKRTDGSMDVILRFLDAKTAATYEAAFRFEIDVSPEGILLKFLPSFP